MRRVDVYMDRLSCIALRVREQVRIDRRKPVDDAGYATPLQKKEERSCR